MGRFFFLTEAEHTGLEKDGCANSVALRPRINRALPKAGKAAARSRSEGARGSPEALEARAGGWWLQGSRRSLSVGRHCVGDS